MFPCHFFNLIIVTQGTETHYFINRLRRFLKNIHMPVILYESVPPPPPPGGLTVHEKRRFRGENL